MKVVVFGASGVVGRAAAAEFSRVPDCTVVGVSRRPPRLPGVTDVAVDLAGPTPPDGSGRTPSGA